MIPSCREAALDLLDNLSDFLKGGTTWKIVPPPRELKAFPGTEPATRKTPVQGGGGLRKRWVDRDGGIYEWDYQHGRVERYNKRGKHIGEFDAETGEQTKPADPDKKVEP